MVEEPDTQGQILGHENEPEFLEYEFAEGDELLVTQSRTPEDELFIPVTREELLRAQPNDQFCQDATRVAVLS